MTTFDAVIAGAGIAGASTAFHLTRAGLSNVLLCDPRPPLTLTSDKSTECYRNWWPGPGTDMVEFMDRSIDLLEAHLEQSAGAFNLSRRGYLFVTKDDERMASMTTSAAEIGRLGAGEIRLHVENASAYHRSTSLEAPPNGADVFLTPTAIRDPFPFLPDDVSGGIHVRRAGWLSAQQYGAWLVDRAREAGVNTKRAAVERVEVGRNGVEAVLVGGEWIRTKSLFNAAGPMIDRVASMVGERLPVVNELHLKTAFLDHLGAVPRDAPMVIVNDPQTLDWSGDEHSLLEQGGRLDLTGEMPASCHARPEGGPDSQWVLGLWEYGATVMEPQWPIPQDDLYTEVVIRGLEHAFPALEQYRERLPRAAVDGGYYTKAPDNRPLIGPTKTPGSHVVGALSGFGIMAAAAAGELAAAYVSNGPLPAYAGAFDIARFDDPDYLARSAEVASGQL